MKWNCFTLKIELGNDAMRNTEDISHALEQVARKLRAGQGYGKVLDANGNSVGMFTFEKEVAP